MDFSACPDGFEAYYTPPCAMAGSPAAGQVAHTAPAVMTWHIVPLSPSATALVLVLLTVLFATLLVSKPEK